MGHVHASALHVAEPRTVHTETIPIRQQDVFPREGGDPDWAPAFAGEQGSGSRSAQDRASLSDPTTTPDAPKNGEIAQTPRPPLTDVLIRCPTRASERTLSGCPTPPYPACNTLGPERPYRTPYRAMCRTL